MGNISSIISSHNKDILNPFSNTVSGCNCISKESCPLQNKCLTPKIVYRADLKILHMMKKTFALELQEHLLKNVFVTTRGTTNTPNTEIAMSYQTMWELKDAHISPVIEWSFVTKVLSKTQLNFCKLCLSEKFYIIKSLNDPNLLNKKSELVSTCRHQSKLLLKSFKKNRYSERNDTMD